MGRRLCRDIARDWLFADRIRGEGLALGSDSGVQGSARPGEANSQAVRLRCRFRARRAGHIDELGAVTLRPSLEPEWQR